MKNTVVLYHKNCADGFGAAWAAWKKLGTAADYISVVHQEPPPENIQGKRIYLLDFSYDTETTKKLIAGNKRVTAIDHHADRASDIQLTYDYRYDPTHSGAVLAWQYFHPHKPIPYLLRYIEDGDLWRFALPQTQIVYSFLALYPQDFVKWNSIARAMEKAQTRKKQCAVGALILRYEKTIIDRLVLENVYAVDFAGYTPLVVNAPLLQSQIGNALCLKKPPLGIVWYEQEGKRKYSLRSDGTIDVSAIARKFGGGGHKAAAGFSIPVNEPFPWKTIAPHS